MTAKRLIAVGKRHGQRAIVRCQDGEATTVQGWDAWAAEMQRRQARQAEQWEVIEVRAQEKVK